MTDKWFLQDIENQLKYRKRVVFLDPQGQCSFLLPLLEAKKYTILKTDSHNQEEWQTIKEELFIRYEAETNHIDDNVIFYVTREQDKLSFLFDYCFTHGLVDFSKPTEWLKRKLFSNTGLQVQIDTPMLLTAAKLGVGKDISWWKKILQNLEDLITIEEELLPFLHKPEEYLNSKEEDIRRLFEEKLFELIGQPYMSKPAKTLANEVVKRLFDGLVYNDIPEQLLNLYYRWVDSDTYSKSLNDYIEKYQIDESVNVWNVHPDHCFNDLDRKTLKHLTENLRDQSFIKDKLPKIRERVNSKKVKKFVPGWWQDLLNLIEFDINQINSVNSFKKIVQFYIELFMIVDRAIRILYTNFLQEPQIIRPIQELYESYNKTLLEYWFTNIEGYKETQQGYLPRLINSAKPSIAVIVGDGIRYEIADSVTNKLSEKFKIDKEIMFADLPTETENNMSALYVGDNKVVPVHREREKSLKNASTKEITFLNLEAVHYGLKADYLILSYKDIDDTGEKLQQRALKLFEEFEDVLVEKISLLMNIGYEEVHLISDHGFVLTGVLDESDKIEPKVAGIKEIRERYIRTSEKLKDTDWLCIDKPYKEYKYIYLTKNHKPFRSKGVYGYSHGGFTPQEIILPNFIFRKRTESIAGLRVIILNKKELLEIAGELFSIKIQAASSTTDLFSSTRKVQLLLYANGINYTSSNIITMETGQTESFEFSFQSNNEAQAALVDAVTQEQLDITTIKKSQVRDLSGLN